MNVIDDPAAAIAASRCLTARSLAGRQGPVTVQHPRPCAWCDYPLDGLSRMVQGFLEWSGFSERTRTYSRHDARLFDELTRRDPAAAEAEIVAAQGLEALEPEPPPPAHESPPPAPAVDEELAAWT